MSGFLKLLRTHQYIKNGFVLLGVVFSRYWDLPTLIMAGLAFIAFCAMSSAVYVLNDFIDVEADRLHPKNKFRPIASGEVSLKAAYVLLGLLVTISLLSGIYISYTVTGLLLSYLILNIAYSLKYKHVVILDVFIISAGFMLRILAGSWGIGIPPSHWLLLCGLMLTLFLGFAKRHSELSLLESSGKHDRAITRKVLDDYSPVLLEQYISVSAACTIIGYGLYTVSETTISTHGSANLIYTLPFVVYGIFRYLYLLHRQSRGGDTARDLLTDAHLLSTVTGWVATCVWVLL